MVCYSLCWSRLFCEWRCDWHSGWHISGCYRQCERSPTSRHIFRLTVTRHTAMVAFWGRNAEAIHIEHMVDVGSREPVVLLVMGCACKKT